MGSYRSRSIYQLHIQLEEIEPAIWRRIIVPGKISLARLHRLLQLAMGWENYHLHLFTIGEVLLRRAGSRVCRRRHPDQA